MGVSARAADLAGLDDAARVGLLTANERGGSGPPPRVVIDTDTYNEIDDQFALVHALLSPDRAKLEAIYAAPFENERSSGPADGMAKSFDEIGQVLDRVDAGTMPVLEGSREWLTERGSAEDSAAVQDLVARALAQPEPLYVVAIGAPTNVSNALLLAPEIARRVVVVWLGGHSVDWPYADASIHDAFNLRQDPEASRVLFDSGVALVHIPCFGVTDRLVTSRDEIEHWVRPAGRIGAFLADRFVEYVREGPGVSKVIWDLAATGWVLERSWARTILTHSPVLTNELRWSRDAGRHLVGEVTSVDRDGIFGDLFRRLAAHEARSSVE